ncbi:FG-GAP repeat domain-containing protein, partial [Limnospira platensis]|uniref:FG-GAP repeat domain-containing protein n=1 Tax=Limnospira platensis TaxID=118562 RepID=UPI00396C9A25
TNISLAGVYRSSVATADFNGDGDIDILLTGQDSSNNRISQVYTNDTVFASPAKAIYEADSSNGTWQYSTDGDTTWVNFPTVSETNALLLDGSSQVRFVPNPDYRGEATYNFRAWDQSDGLSVGTTADVSTNGGTTAYSGDTATATITINPVKQAPILSQTEFTLTAIDEDSTDHTGDNLGTIIGDSITVDELTNILDFSLNTNISLTGVYLSSVATADFNGDGDIDILLTGRNSRFQPISRVYLNDGSGGFTQATNISLTGVDFSSVATADFNGDGDIDILLTGRDSSFQPISRVYLNDGSGGFTHATNISLTGVRYSSVATADFNGDGDIDILLTGRDSSNNRISRVYLNDGSGGFTHATNISLTGVNNGSVATADFNGDGDIDILLTGRDSSNNPISRVYLNDGSGGFTHATNISLTGVRYSSVATADFNGDGDIDILLTGRDSSNNRISRVYLNDGSGGFTHATNISLTGV